MSLPVPTDRSEVTRRFLVLNAGRNEGWWTYEVAGDTSKAASMRYWVRLGKDGRAPARELLPEEVLPWALGVADAKRRPDVVAYREGLLPEN